ncbi:DUF7007 domain-containing protein [Achromobacter anxifer]|uniref:DUF7007 domain-containing protein n=1 Tax=Achromobacter anxifer TaxID=1287737 RepID=UPI0023F7994B|nr:hypothetical protein [Achromobacter anxifer]MDF8359432.1 hypothetical protein [Achromobacter anxifer]
MRLLPATRRDAKEMARELCNQLTYLGLSADCRVDSSPPLSLQQTQEFMARAMGYVGGWRELNLTLKTPRQPVYLDSPAGADLLTSFATRLSEQLGYPYAHGRVYSAIQNSGAGYSPKTRRQMQDAETPWGIGEFTVLLPGIESVETDGHGGYRISAHRLAQMPAHLRMEGGWYEEDGEFLLVALVFSDFANFMNVEQLAVLHYLDIVHRPYTPQADDVESLEFGLPGITLDEYKELVANRRNQPKNPLSQAESNVVRYLVECVLENRAPYQFPTEQTLREWISTLSTLPLVNGQWPKRPPPWKLGWDWVSRSEEAERLYDEMYLGEGDSHQRH